MERYCAKHPPDVMWDCRARGGARSRPAPVALVGRLRGGFRLGETSAVTSWHYRFWEKGEG